MIAFICHPYHRGGVTRWMVDMAIASGHKGIDVFFVTVSPKKEFISAGGKEAIVDLLAGNKGVKIISEKVGWEFEFGTESYRASIYSKLLNEKIPQGIPVILSNDPSVWMVSALLKGHNNFVGVLHADEKPYYDLAKKYESTIDTWVCVSNRVKNNLLQTSDSLHAKTIHVIPCGIFLPEYHNLSISNGDGVQLVYVGRIDEHQKRVSDLVDIALGLKSKNVDFQLNIIGDGPEKTALENKVHESGLTNVSFLGWLSKDQITDILGRADLLLLTSNFEGMPVAVMEALSAGCGIVSTRVSGVEDLEHDPLASQCLWLYEVGDIDAAVKNIIYAVTNAIPSARSKSARLLAEKEFSMEMCMNRYGSAIAEYRQMNAMAEIGTSIINNAHSYIISFLRITKRGILSAIRK